MSPSNPAMNLVSKRPVVTNKGLSRDSGWILACCSFLASLFFVACDSSLYSEPPSAVCTESGAQCQLSKGPLGVCERSACQPGESSPCFQCTSQH